MKISNTRLFKYFPGDVVKENKSGTIAIVVKAQMTINGKAYNWNEDLPEGMDYCNGPSYALDEVSGSLSKHAWFSKDELTLMKSGSMDNFSVEMYQKDKNGKLAV